MPYPPDYGGVFDLFYKIKWLHQLGVKIYLHCFEYGRGRQSELNKYCVEVHYYHREKITAGIPLRLPYIVSSRINPLLLTNMSKDNYPVLLEGIHCTYYLYHGELRNRKVWVRLHNVEFEYYRQLAKSTTNFYKKIYFTLESRLLKRYENAIAKKANLLAVNEKDKQVYERQFLAENIEVLPVFLPFEKITSQEGKGTFCLYHGNLSVVENEKVVFWLLQNVFSNADINFVVAGKNPSEGLRKEINKNKQASLIENPSEEILNGLIKEAHIHVLPSFNATGIKIKLLNALFNGRFIVTNQAGVDGTGLQSLCELAENPADYKRIIQQLLSLSFRQNEIIKRNNILNSLYNNAKNALRLTELL